MIPTLFHGSLWLAALAAGAAALGPEGSSAWLAALAGLASLSAWRLWRAGRTRPMTVQHTDATSLPPETLQIDGAALQDVAARIGQLASSATSLDAALHGAAKILKSELGALHARVYRVQPPLSGAPARSRITESIATRNGFHAAGELPSTDGSEVVMAVRRELAVLALPDALALPIFCNRTVVAVLALGDIAISFDDDALHELLAVTANTLAKVAGRGAPGAACTAKSGVDDESQFPWSEFDAPPHPNSLRHGPSLTMLPRRSPLHVSVTGPAGPAIGGSGSTAASAVLDSAALARLAELDPTGTSRLLPRVLTAYLTSVARLHPQFVAARPKRDFEAIRHVTHTLKSSSASIGAIKLAAICAEIDNMIRTADTAGLDPHLDSMDAELGRVLKAVKHLLGGHP